MSKLRYEKFEEAVRRHHRLEEEGEPRRLAAIIALGEDYEYAVVGHPGRNYLWILSRTPSMDDALYNQILERLQKEKAYDTSKLIKTVQPNSG